MSVKRTLSLILIASVMLLAAGFAPWVSNSARALPLAQTNVTVPYTGSLTDQSGQAVVDGSYEFTFKLYDFEKAGEPLWTEAQTGVAVLDGTFSVILGSVNPLPQSILESGARWLEVEVRGPGEKAYTTLSPRQELRGGAKAAPTGLAAPQALSCEHNHLNENWIGSSANYSLRIENSSTGDGIRGISYATGHDYAGVTGAAYANSGTGVYGLSTVDGYGVFGSSATGVGVVGKVTDSTTTNWVTGVWGQVAAPGTGSQYVRGVVGWATNTTGVNYGMWGQSESGTGTGVYGLTSSSSCSSSHYGTCNGVKGKSDYGNGASGVTNNGTALFGYVNGSGKGLEIWSTGSGNLIEAWHEGAPSDTEFKVDYLGNVTADGTYSSPAADMAEMLPAVAGLWPGDVLVIGADGQLTRSTTAYQATVVGVYSTKPGFVGGGGDDANLTGKVPLAVIGVVPVKASAENGAIQPGDLLVASAIPGHAMKAGANPAVGTIIGKALASLESGTGVIQMLVMLQ